MRPLHIHHFAHQSPFDLGRLPSLRLRRRQRHPRGARPPQRWPLCADQSRLRRIIPQGRPPRPDRRRLSGVRIAV